MNKERRSELEDIASELEDIASRLEDVQSDEQDAFDNLPEGLQCSITGERMEGYIDMIQDRIDQVRECAESVLEIVTTKL